MHMYKHSASYKVDAEGVPLTPVGLNAKYISAPFVRFCKRLCLTSGPSVAFLAPTAGTRMVEAGREILMSDMAGVNASSEGRVLAVPQ